MTPHALTIVARMVGAATFTVDTPVELGGRLTGPE